MFYSVKKFKSQFKDLIKAARRNNEASSESANSTTVAEGGASASSEAELAGEGNFLLVFNLTDGLLLKLLPI